MAADTTVPAMGRQLGSIGITPQKRKAEEDDVSRAPKRGKEHSCQTYFRPISQVKHLDRHLCQKKAWIDGASSSVLRSVFAARKPELDGSKAPTVKRKADEEAPHLSKKAKPLDTIGFRATKVFNSDTRLPSSSKTVKPLGTLDFRVTRAINSDIRYFLYASGKDAPNKLGRGHNIAERPISKQQKRPQKKTPRRLQKKTPRRLQKKPQKTPVTGLVSWLQGNGAVD